MKILLTGANGFLGKNLLTKLDANLVQILVIVRKLKKYPKNVKAIKDDIGNLKNSNLKIIKDFKPEVIINLAWSGIPDYSFKNSLENFFNHYKFIKELSSLKSVKKIIMTGSCWEYPSKTGNCREIKKVIPSNPFIWSKISLFNYLNELAKAKNINFIWLRIFFMYGKFQKKESLIPHIIKSLKENKKPKIMSPNNENDFINVEDVCKAIVSSVKINNLNGIFNIGSGKLTSVREIYKIILENLNKNNDKYTLSGTKEKKILGNYADTKKINKQLLFRSEINIRDGLNKLLES